MNEPTLLDQLRRPLRDLRISLTDRCNLRCGYCMPREVYGDSYPFLPPQHLMSFEEIARLARLFVISGVKKIRLTGGEPLMRSGVDDLVAMLAAIRGIEDLAMTSNGIMLGHYCERLALAGLNRVTVSLDAVDEEVFATMSGTGAKVSRVIDGIRAAVLHGLPVKVNAVIIRGKNESQILPLVRLALAEGFSIRFIEYMDVGETNHWRGEDVVSGAEIHDIIHAVYPLEPLAAEVPGEVAKRHRIVDSTVQVGLITSVTKPFCADCNRARLSSDGRLFTCLFAGQGTDMLGPMRDGASDQEILEKIAAVWLPRNDCYSELRGLASGKKAEMSYLGG